MSVPVPDVLEAAPTVRPKRRQPVLWAFVGVVVLAVVGSVVGSAVVRANAPTAADAARGYLQALADGDAARALSFTSSAPVETLLLTDAVLADSQRRAPLTDVQVVADPSSEGSVDVTYRLGETPVHDHYSLSRVSGVWKMDKIGVPVDFMPVLDARLPVLVNGQKVDSQAREAFPVSYVVTTGLDAVDWGPKASTVVTLDQPATDLKLAPRLTTAGQKAFLAGAHKVISSCTAKHQLLPDDCPFGFRQPTSGPKIPDSTVRWTVKGDPWAKVAKPEIDSVLDPGTAKASVSMTFTCTCRFSTGEACKPQDATSTVVFAADLSRSPLKVVLTAY